LSPIIGLDRKQTTATGCFRHSDDVTFLTVRKEDCQPEFVCIETSTSTSNSSSEVNICSTDGQADVIELRNNQSIEIGDHYVFLITDENEILQEVVAQSSFNFEGSSAATQRVYGIHFDGTLNPVIGLDRNQTTASGCFQHSDDQTFLTIRKENCQPEFVCIETLTATTDWETEISICPTDGQSDEVELRNSQSLEIGEHYVFLITDENEILQQVVAEAFYDFQGSGLETQRVYGIHFDGTLNPILGADRKQTTASGCFQHSGDNLFLTVTKDACVPDFECLETLTATTDWVTEVSICPTDGQSDIVELKNNQSITAGEHYAYLITDENEVLQQVSINNTYDFEGSGIETQRVYGIHFDGILSFVIGEDRKQTTASECFEHSGDDLFLTIRKDICIDEFECLPTLTATTDWVTDVSICPTDGQADILELRNSQFIRDNDHYAYLITDENEILQEVTTDTTYNFEGSGLATQRVYGIHYNGELNSVIGANRKQTTATGCFEHSGDNLFLTVTKDNCADEFECIESLVATVNWITDVGLCSSDGIEDNILLQNNVNVAPGEHYVFLLTDAQEILQEVIIDSFYNFEGTGNEEQRVYGLSYAGTLDIRIGEPRKNTTASECFIHSGDNLFITLNKTATCNTTSTSDLEVEDFVKIYPNPSNGFISIDYLQKDKIKDINIYSINGQLMQTIYNEKNIYIEQSGMYSLRIATEEGILTKRIVIQ